jgi:glutathione S-transferase
VATELHKGFSPLFNPATPEEFKAVVRKQLEKKFQYVNEELKDKQWLMGSRFTVVDAYLFTVLRWAYGLKLDLAGLTNIEAYVERMKARPAVSAALTAEGI